MAGESDHAFLSEKRREVVRGEYEGSDSGRRAHETHTRRQARMALDELIEVAESPTIDTTEVFDPDQVFKLLRALLQPDYPDHYSDGLQGGVVENPEEHYTDEYLAYTGRLYVQMNKLLMGYHEQGDDDETESEQTES